MTPAQKQAYQERDKLFKECSELLFEIAYTRPYFLKVLYGVRYALQTFRAYKDPSFKVDAPPSMQATDFQRLVDTQKAA